ncbi:Uncharacterized protein YjbI, contains pentapeptide repeats [Salegentibacter echinorum]|uniref:Uncharacterized protein YjbI, contains pentapeptide repeats n=1 Tax=Salegentibacter echinorum TaxID=1073325 RepID=A0A1M5H6D0_SALEC|nr:pentapeptide repeat-containing protein [Salegentibacter echinorum]SHG11453.1 Uncharacterized protein YjbI, contains pentapeptide repeats [Salegentibacter echinorum]
MKNIKVIIVIFIIILIITIVLDFYDSQFSYHDILVEFHGLLFDLLVLGIIYGVYENFSNKKERIENLKESIEDYRGLNTINSSFKIVSFIRRLYDLGVNEFSLHQCFLQDAKLNEYNFRNSNFSFSNLENASFSRSNLENCKFYDCRLREAFFVDTIAYNARFENANLSETTITKSDFSFANLRRVKLNKAKICATDFNCADMSFADLEGVKVYDQNWLETLEINEVKGIEKLKERFYIDRGVFEVDEIGEYWIVLKKTS